MRTILTAALLLASLLPTAVAVADDFDTLLERFGVVHRSLRSAGVLSDDDRPVVERFRADVRAFSESHPERAEAVAMELQLSMWLADDDRVSELYGQLARLRPDDAEMALSWIRYRERPGGVTPEEILVELAALVERFPGSLPVADEYARRLLKVMRYEETSAVLLREGLAPWTSYQPFATLLDSLFAQHRFADGLAQIEKARASEDADAVVLGQLDRRRDTFEQYQGFWDEEQSIRETEAAAADLPQVEVVTGKGRIVVELFENEAPNTVANFVSLAESGYYAGTRFHRFVADFMIQGGDPNSRVGSEATPGTGGPGYTIKDEFGLPIARKHFRDSLAMAKTGAADSGGSQFYFNHRPTDHLNGRHTVFGRVIEGRDVVLVLRQDDEITSMTVLRKRDHEYVPQKIEAAAPIPAAVTTPPTGTISPLRIDPAGG